LRKGPYNEGSARENNDDDTDDDCDDCGDKNRTKNKKHKRKKKQNNNHNINYMFSGKNLHLTPLLRASCHGKTYAKRREAGNDGGRSNLHVDRAAGANYFTKLSSPYLHPPNKTSIITEANDHCQIMLRYY
jgi:hypothetical protein